MKHRHKTTLEVSEVNDYISQRMRVSGDLNEDEVVTDVEYKIVSGGFVGNPDHGIPDKVGSIEVTITKLKDIDK